MLHAEVVPCIFSRAIVLLFGETHWYYSHESYSISIMVLFLRHDPNHGGANEVQNFVYGGFGESTEGGNQGDGFFHERIRGHQVHQGGHFGTLQIQFFSIIRFFAKGCECSGIIDVKKRE